MILDLIFMLVYTIFNVQMIPNNVDQAMFNNGILRSLVNGNIGTELMMEDLIAKLDKRAVVFLVSSIVEQQIGVCGKPFHHPGPEFSVLFEHAAELIFGEFQHLHRAQSSREDGAFYLEVLLVVTGEHGSTAVKRQDLSPAVFMFHVVLGQAGKDVVDPPEWLAGLPEVIPFCELPPDMGVGQKIIFQRAEILDEKIARRQHAASSPLLCHCPYCSNFASPFAIPCPAIQKQPC